MVELHAVLGSDGQNTDTAAVPSAWIEFNVQLDI